MSLQPAIEKVGQEKLTVRMKFMIETINDLKNNRMKTGLAASSITSEHFLRMRKLLGSLNTRSLKGTEALRIDLQDIRQSDKRGKWWLVGASYRDADASKAPIRSTNSQMAQSEGEVTEPEDGAPPLLQLALEHRMNTDIRRQIFVTVMSATDYRDAHMRLMKLRLKKSQELEIPRVLVHCASAETVYNPYYTLISRLLCSDRKLKVAFRFSLWDVFRRLGEDTEADEVDEVDDQLTTRGLVNISRLYGTLLAEGALGLSILKVRALERPRAKLTSTRS